MSYEKTRHHMCNGNGCTKYLNDGLALRSDSTENS